MTGTQFYVTTDGHLIGGFGDGAVPDDPTAVLVDAAPPNVAAVWDFDAGAWAMDPAEVLAAQHAEVQAARAAAYREEADPLFFKYQRGEADAQEWLDKVAEIRARYPYPEG
jgi:hypothetical protein